MSDNFFTRGSHYEKQNLKFDISFVNFSERNICIILLSIVGIPIEYLNTKYLNKLDLFSYSDIRKFVIIRCHLNG